MGQILVAVEHLMHSTVASPSLESGIAAAPVAVAAVMHHPMEVHSKNLSAVLTTMVHQLHLAALNPALEHPPMVCCCSRAR